MHSSYKLKLFNISPNIFHVDADADVRVNSNSSVELKIFK